MIRVRAKDSKMAIEKEESAADRSFGKFNVKGGLRTSMNSLELR